MSKAYLLMICLLVTSFTGCTYENDGNNDSDEESNDKIKTQDWEFFYIDEPDLQVVRNDTTNFAVGVANFGKFSQNFTVSGQDFGFPGLSATQMRIFNLYSDKLSGAGNSALGYYDAVSFTLEPDNIQIILMEIFHNGAGVDNMSDHFSLNASTTGYNYDNPELKEGTKFLNFTVNVIEKGEGGKQVEIGDSVEVHYAGFLESNGRLFDSSIEYIWDNYGYFMEGTTDANRHTATLPAHNVGCNAEGDPSEYCEGSRQMIPGFDQGMLGMYVNQTLYVVIPPEDAYGKTGSSDLAGETLIFSIRIVSVE